MINGSIQEDDVMIVHIYICIYMHTGAPKYIKQILTDIKRETDSNTIIVGDFNIPLTTIQRKSISKCWPK